MGRSQKPLSHAEIWDDSALQKSWDDALSEYKLYHSIHARGERVEDILREAEETEIAVLISNEHNASSSKKPACTSVRELEDGEVEDGQMGDELGDPAPSTTEPPHPVQPQEANNTTEHSKAVHDTPQILISNVKDDALRNLMMSWYYAGYYTGLFEGQQQSAYTANSNSMGGVNGGR